MGQADIQNETITAGVTQMWSYPTDSDAKWGPAAVAVSPDGCRIAATTGKTAYMLSREGKLLWILPFDFPYEAIHRILVTSDGNVIGIGNDVRSSPSDRVYAISPDGKLLHRCTVDQIPVEIASSADRTMLVVRTLSKRRFGFLNQGLLLLFDQEGRRLWKETIRGSISAVSLSANGSLIAVGSEDGWVHVFTSEGKLLWRYEVRHWISAVAFSGDPSFVAVGSDKLYALDTNGDLSWTFSPGGSIVEVSTCSHGSHLVARSGFSKLHLLTADGELLREYTTEPAITNIVSILPDTTVIATQRDSRMRDPKILDSLPPDLVPCTVYMLASEGQVLWKFKLSSHSPVLSASCDGTILAVGAQNNVVLYRCKTPRSLLEDRKCEIVGMIRNALQKGNSDGKT